MNPSKRGAKLMEISLTPALVARLKEWLDGLEGVDLEVLVPIIIEKALEADPLMDEVMDRFSK
jgi:type IV secretory pathway TrbD component